jgi:hypothetical protein
MRRNIATATRETTAGPSLPADANHSKVRIGITMAGGGFMRVAGIGIVALALAACAQAPATVQRPAPTQPAPTEQVAAAPAAWVERLTETAKANALTLNHVNGVFSGPAWDRLVAEGRAAQFFLLGEEHGIAENPKLTGQLFEALAPAGYSKLIIEVSPPMAGALDESARKGIDGLKAQFATPGGEAAFFGMKEEAEMLARARAAVTGDAPVFWGVDYEVGGDRLLMTMLEAMPKPKAAADALATLRAASTDSWAKHASERNPHYIFSFSGDPALVRAVRDAWPGRSAEASTILTALEETLEINGLWMRNEGYDSNVRRSTYMRSNLVAHWQAEKAAGRTPRVFAKMGMSHLIRGRNQTETWDIGTLIPEIAALEGGRAFSVAILPGKGSAVAVFDPVGWRYNPDTPKDDYMAGLDPLYAAASPDAFTLIDLRPLRAIMGRWRDGTDPELMRIVHGFDMLLIMSGSTASANLMPQ